MVNHDKLLSATTNRYRHRIAYGEHPTSRTGSWTESTYKRKFKLGSQCFDAPAALSWLYSSWFLTRYKLISILSMFIPFSSISLLGFSYPTWCFVPYSDPHISILLSTAVHVHQKHLFVDCPRVSENAVHGYRSNSHDPWGWNPHVQPVDRDDTFRFWPPLRVSQFGEFNCEIICSKQFLLHQNKCRGRTMIATQ